MRRRQSLRLRPYEVRAINRVLAEWKRARSTIVIGPTGSGKTVIFCKVAERRRPKGRILVLADRQDLVEQANTNMRRLTSLTSEIEMGEQIVNLRALPDVVCASLQTMVNRLDTFNPKLFATVIFDEADLALAPTYRKVLAYFGKAKLLGVTATPDRHDGQSLSQLFQTEAFKITYSELMPQYVSRIRQQSVKVLELKLVKRGKHGDFDERALGEVLSEEKPLHEVVTATRKLAGDRPTLVFAATVEHARKLAAMFNRYKRGSARAIDGDMDATERRSIIEPFRQGKFQFLCNCALLSRGVDIPMISCIAMARPTMSRPLYAQMVGRGTRIHPGKRDLLVLDFVDNSLRNSLIEDVTINDGERASPENEREKPHAKAPRTVSVVDALFPEEPDDVRLLAYELLNSNPGSDLGETIQVAKKQLAADAALRVRVLAEVKRLQVRDVGLGIDWSSITATTWRTMTNPQLAKILGCSSALVFQHRPVNFPSPAAANRHPIPSNIDWAAQPWKTETNRQIADRLGVSRSVVDKRRPSEIPSPWNIPNSTLRAEASYKTQMKFSPEQRRRRALKASAAMTTEQRAKMVREARLKQTPERRSEIGRIARANLPVLTFEQRSNAARKANAGLTAEQRAEKARKINMSYTFERRSAAMSKVNAMRTPEQRSEIAKKIHAAMSPEQRAKMAERARKMMTPEHNAKMLKKARKAIAAMTPEQLSERARKAAVTRNLNRKS